MAVACTNLVQGQDGTDDADSVVGSATYTTGRLYLLTICSRADAVQPTISSISAPTGSGITWTIIGTANNFDASGSRRTMFLYRGVPSSTVTSGFTITWGATQTAKTWNVDEITGMDTSGTQGSGAIVQTVTNSGASVTSLTVTLGAFSSTSNATYGAFGNAGEGALSAGSGFTRFGNQQLAGEAGLGTEFKASNDTTVDMSNGTMDIGGIAIEIAIAPTVVRTSTGSISSATSGNITLDCTGGDLVVIGWSAFDTTLADRTASTVTVGGASATIVAGSKADNTTSNGQAQLAYYIAPSTGSQTVTLTMGGTCTNVDWYASLVTGAKQSGQPDVQGQNTTTAGTSCTVTVTTATDNALLFDAMNGNVGPMTPNASQTSIMNLSGSTGRGSYKETTTAGSYSMIYTTAGSDDYALGVIAIAKASSSSTTYPGYYGSGGYF